MLYGFWPVVFKNSRKRECSSMAALLPPLTLIFLLTVPQRTFSHALSFFPWAKLGAAEARVRAECSVEADFLHFRVLWRGGTCESHWHPFTAVSATPNSCPHPTADPIP